MTRKKEKKKEMNITFVSERKNKSTFEFMKSYRFRSISIVVE